METLNVRRKKRKTRRCLDELRKRTHQSNNVCSTSNKNTIDIEHKKSLCKLKTSNYITSNRLTLLNKTVKSETVTRLQLTDLKNKKLKRLNRQNTESGFHKNLICHEPAKYNVNAILGNHIDTITEDTNVPDGSPDLQIHEEGNYESPKSIILFSPDLHEDNVATNANHNSSIGISNLSSPSSSLSNLNNNSKSIDGDYLMDAFDSYMEQNFPNITCNGVEKWRSDLLNMYIKNQNIEAQEYNSISDADLTNDKETSEENIIENPKDYLWKYLPYTITSEVDASHTTSNSSDSIDIPSCSPNPTAVCDTPEYAYYPHRLN